jgi:hypothetical protein
MSVKVDAKKRTWFDFSFDVFSPTELKESLNLLSSHLRLVIDDGNLGSCLIMGECQQNSRNRVAKKRRKEFTSSVPVEFACVSHDRLSRSRSINIHMIGRSSSLREQFGFVRHCLQISDHTVGNSAVTSGHGYERSNELSNFFKELGKTGIGKVRSTSFVSN